MAAFKIKRGRPRAEYKVRKLSYVAPKNFKYHKFDEKKQEIIFKREKQGS